MDRGAVDKYSLLPTIDGPKLPRFGNVPLRIQYLELLSTSMDSDGNPDAVHGYVFKVIINSKPFALKIVRLSIDSQLYIKD
jgi:Kinetochore Sim4 complex subunit FTA2